MTSDKNIDNLAKKFGLPPGMEMLFMFAIVLMPLGQQTTEEGSQTEKAQAPQ